MDGFFSASHGAREISCPEKSFYVCLRKRNTLVLKSCPSRKIKSQKAENIPISGLLVEAQTSKNTHISDLARFAASSTSRQKWSLQKWTFLCCSPPQLSVWLVAASHAFNQLDVNPGDFSQWVRFLALSTSSVGSWLYAQYSFDSQMSWSMHLWVLQCVRI